MSRLFVFPISDLHLEFDNKDISLLLPNPPGIFDKTSDTSCLVIAGDLSYPSKKTFVQFFKKCKEIFDIVIFVAGNHEYYKQGCPTDIVDQRIKQLCEQCGCTFLQKESIVIKLKDERCVRIAGCTYWSKIREHNKQVVSLMLNDFKEIVSPFTKKLLSTNCYNNLHQDHHYWLNQEVTDNQPDIVVTHHLVSSLLVHEKWKGSPINDGFSSDDFNDKQLKIPKVWISGHTHQRMDINLPNGTRLLTNPSGYRGEISGFEKDLFLLV